MKNHRTALLAAACFMGALVGRSPACAQEAPVFQDTFMVERSQLYARAQNDYFMPLVPGYKLLLKGPNSEGEEETLLITVMPQHKVVDGVICAVVREKEWREGEVVEISWNYVAISRLHRTIFYFGEEVDIYEDGEVVSHEGAWLSGVNGARFGVLMPGFPLVGSRYYQEVAPGIALDRAEHLSLTSQVQTPAGTFKNCLFIEETTPLTAGDVSYKFYAPKIGLVQDGSKKLVAYGFHVTVPGLSSD